VVLLARVSQCEMVPDEKALLHAVSVTGRPFFRLKRISTKQLLITYSFDFVTCKYKEGYTRTKASVSYALVL
jgi:hypothetical protein